MPSERKRIWPRHWEAPHVVAWRALWWLPAQAARLLFVALILAGWGPHGARCAWRDTQ